MKTKWKNLLTQVAPSIATAIGGPAAGAAVGYLSEALLGKKDGTNEEIEAALSKATPDELLRIKEAGNAFDLKMKELDIDITKIDSDDRKNARSMAVNTSLWPQICLSAIFIVGYFILIYFIFSGKFTVQASIRDMSNLLIGILTAGIPMILRFWFGGSIHDESNIDKLHNSTPNK
tara:strand:+ start:1873 stop:2400 length:528 start_codon:yes stop_codon:yes gene_type:complete